MIWVISSSLKENLSTTLSVCRLKGGSVLEFLKKQHWEAKNFLKSSAFCKKFGTVSPLTSSGGIKGILIFFEERFNIFQYVFRAVRQSFRFSFISRTCFSFEYISFVNSFDIMFKLSKSFSILLFLKYILVNFHRFFNLSFINFAIHWRFWQSHYHI